MRSPAQRAEILALVEAGVNDCEIARRTGVPRTTVRDIRRARRRPTVHPCPRCWRRARPATFSSADYAELLGLYLGDGCISRVQKTYSLRLALDSKYPGIIADAEELVARCLPGNRVNRVGADRGATTVVCVYSSHLPCLFPQHGPGKKHTRPILLEEWQAGHVRAAPFAFLRGLVRSDGCIFVNRTGRYEYLSVDFRNDSADIRALFTGACDLVGVEYRAYSERVRIYRRASVERLVARIGLKR